MKKIITVMIFIGALTFYANSQKVWIPVGSSTSTSGQCTTIKPPSGYNYVAVKENGQVYESEVGASPTICCDCTAGNGPCNPVNGGGFQGCVFGSPCTACIMGAIIRNSDGSTSKITGGGFVNASWGVGFIKTKDELPALNAALLQSKVISGGINTFLKGIYGDKQMPEAIMNGSAISPPSGFKLALINAYGRGLIILVPKDFPVPAAAAAGSASCSCSGGGGCKIKNTFWGSYCEGTCYGSCCMGAIVSGGTIKFTTAQF